MRLTLPAIAMMRALSGAAAHAASLAHCTSAISPEAVVLACTKVIDSPGTPSQDLFVARLERAEAYAGIGDYDYAGKDYDAALEIDPSSVEALYARGQFRVARQERDKAIEDFTAAIALSPDDPKLYIERGLTLFRNMKYDAAIADQTVAIKLLPSDALPLNARSCALIHKGDYAAAIADAELAIKLAPWEAIGYLNRAAANAKMGNQAAARRDYDRVALMEPDKAVARSARFYYDLEHNMHGAAQDVIESLPDNETEQLALWRSYGVVCDI